MSIHSWYETASKTVSDINEHLPVIYEYAKKCSHITEFGFRGGNSASAMLAAKPKTFISYDIVVSPEVPKLSQELTADPGMTDTKFIFINDDTRGCDIAKTDLLFIDTEHTGSQVLAELNKHAGQVKKYIIFHDVATFPEYAHAIDQWISAHLVEWEEVERRLNNNGLLVLKRR